MQISDNTPEPDSLPFVYPANPPINLLSPDELRPRNFFSFEGIDGSGKSTLLKAITSILAARNVPVKALKLAGSDLVRHALERAKWLNVDPMCFSLLNWISIFHQTSTQNRLYNTSQLLFMDRYTLTVRVRGRLEGLPQHYMDLLERMVPEPAAIFLIDCDVDVCLERIRSSQRPITYYESGARHVPFTNAPMVEQGEWERSGAACREAGLRRALIRTREEFLRLASSRPNVHLIDNSREINATVSAILNVLPGGTEAPVPR